MKKFVQIILVFVMVIVVTVPSFAIPWPTPVGDDSLTIIQPDPLHELGGE